MFNLLSMNLQKAILLLIISMNVLSGCAKPKESEETNIRENSLIQKRIKLESICNKNNGNLIPSFYTDQFSCVRKCTVNQAYQSGFIFDDDYKESYFNYFDYEQNKWSNLCIPERGSFDQFCKPDTDQLQQYRAEVRDKIKKFTWTRRSTDWGLSWSTCQIRSEEKNNSEYIDELPSLYHM